MSAMKNLMLHSQETHTGRKGFICVGTTMLYGEEFASRGRVSYGSLEGRLKAALPNFIHKSFRV